MACNKLFYTSRQAAESRLAQIAELNLLTCRPKFTYRCRFCNYWHLTSKEPLSSEEKLARKRSPEARQEKRIKAETEYWIDRLGPDPEEVKRVPKFRR